MAERPTSGSDHGHGHSHRHHHRSHTRSMSPPRSDHNRRDRDRDRDHDRGRKSRNVDSSFESPKGDKYRRSHHRRHRRPSSRSRSGLSPQAPVTLPYEARQLSKRDRSQLEPMFAMYLDIQKGLILDELDEAEVRGRWKSFVKRWNRGGLAEGWYDPATFEKAKSSFAQDQNPRASESAGYCNKRRGSPNYSVSKAKAAESPSRSQSRSRSYATPVGSDRMREVEGQSRTDYRDDDGDEEDDEDAYGPKLPGQDIRQGHRLGPTIPNIQDLELRRESGLEEQQATRLDAYKQRRFELQSHKAEMRSAQDEIAPRAEPGTHERRMEKRREAAATNREFAQGARGGSPIEAAPDADLMGGGAADDLEALKKVRERETRKKNEREIRREEVLRARAAERKVRLQKYRQKEDETMGWLKALAKQRFG